ncbi:hypothetical protein PVK06_026969 [Gossypium arboreum]|uniref:Uncharacterized protein n=1 Tax=Gossypium arboreum TaxID=29729 RepID=A0ABR0NZ38_GOSAR|nr:hypothetical protein PVK06_026969 [Gossypium arboreum]
MLSTVEERVGKLEGSMEDVKEALDGFEGHIDNWKEQSRDYVKMSLDSTMDKVNELFDSHKDKLSDRNDALEAMLMALKEETMAMTLALSTRIEEIEGELALCQQLWGKECQVQHSVARKDKLGSSKSEERGICEGNHKEDTDEYGNGNGDNCGNGKPRVGKKKPKKKRDKLKCFLCDGPQMLKKCPMKSALRKKPMGKALGLGFSTRGVEAKEAKSGKKPVECFLCHGPHSDMEPKKLGSSKGKAEAKRAKRSKSVIEGNDRVDKEPNKLGSSKGKAEAKRAKRSKKKRVKCFLCRGPHELRNCPKQAVVKAKATSEHGESSEGLPPKNEVSLSSDLEKEVAMKAVKLGPMRLESSEASELAESSTRLPPMREVGGASDFKEKEEMHVGQGPFEVLEQGGRETVGKAKPSLMNHEDSVRVKLECGQESDITPCRRDVQTSRTAQVKKRRKLRQKSRRKGKAKATSGIQDESSQCHSGVATRMLQEWVGENVTGQSSKPVTIEPNASDGGLLLRRGSFGPRELA